MGKDNRKPLDFRYYDMPQKEPVILCTGENYWRRLYGVDPYGQLHFHNILEIGICRDGTGKMVYPDDSAPYGAGYISIIPRNIPHDTRSNSLNFWEYIFLDEEYYLEQRFGSDPVFLDQIRQQINERYLLMPSDRIPDIRMDIEFLFREFGAAPRSLYSRELVENCAISLLLMIARANAAEHEKPVFEASTADQVLLKAIRFVDEHYMEDFPVSSLASASGISESHFRRLFSDAMNMTPVDYINMIRIRKACKFIKETDLPMEMIAERAGYSTQSTFNRNFRKFTGQSPYQWKKENRGKTDRVVGMKISAHKGWGKDDGNAG